MGTFRRHLEPLLGDIAAVITLIFAWKSCVDVNSPSGRFVLILLTALVLGLIVFSTVQEYRYSRKARYAEIIGLLSEIYRDILDIAQDSSANVDRIQVAYRDVVTNLANALSLVTGNAVCCMY